MDTKRNIKLTILPYFKHSITLKNFLFKRHIEYFMNTFFNTRVSNKVFINPNLFHSTSVSHFQLIVSNCIAFFIPVLPPLPNHITPSCTTNIKYFLPLGLIIFAPTASPASQTSR